MKNLRNIFLLLLLICTAWACSDSSVSIDEDSIVIETLDAAVESFMQKHNVPGLAVAVTKNEKLVYAKGYGKADLESGTDVNRNSLFRVASVSKPITGIAVMKLMEDGKLSLDATVFGEQGILGTTYGSGPYPAALEQITVEQLLMHTTGSWPNTNSDPMFQQGSLDVYQLIHWVLDNHPVRGNPGSHYAYSNFGYALLGRIIEEVTGMGYEQYVRTEILNPIGATGIQIGGNTRADKKSGEVTYYGNSAYNMNVERLGAPGGWTASAVDLARLLVRVDGFGRKEDILKPETIQIMTTSSAHSNYAKGWSVNSANNWWHAGSLPGTGALIVRGSNGFNWVILANTRPEGNARTQFMNDMDGLMWGVLRDPNTQWPDIDLF